jgi:hypothetical protein
MLIPAYSSSFYSSTTVPGTRYQREVVCDCKYCTVPYTRTTPLHGEVGPTVYR